MNLFDMVIIVILGYCLIRGIFRGLIKELSSIIGVLAGFYAAYTYYTEISSLLSHFIDDKSWSNILSCLIIFCVIFLIISLLGVAIKYLLNIAYMGWFDRVCGAVFGVLKAVLIVSVIFMVFTAFLPDRHSFLKNSLLAPHVALISEKMAKVVSKEMKQEFSIKIGELRKSWKIPR